METLPPSLRALVARLAALGDVVSREDALAALAGSDVRLDDVAPFVQPSPHGYARRRVARTDAFELLVMTWLPGQASVPHDHAGSVCALRILRGRVREALYASGRDGLVEAARAGDLIEGDVLVDTSDHVHSLTNDPDAGQTLVTLHVYAPPLPELRRYALRPAGVKPHAVFIRARGAQTPVVSVVGGGYSGSLVAAHLMTLATRAGRPVHVVVSDRQAAHGEGPAYRTADGRHLLNVPASNMSAWPEAPLDFVDWARLRAPAVAPGDFLPRRWYGEYVRDALASAARSAGEGVSAELRREEVVAIEPTDARLCVRADGAAPLDASVVVVATGHRPPDDPLRGLWHGPRARYVEDPWASLALSAIRADESVLLLGTGLTAVDVLLTVCRSPRTAPVVAISRRGLLPQVHAASPQPALEPRAWLEPLLSRPGGTTARALLAAVREASSRAEASGEDWRRVVDGLRPHLPRIWRALSTNEAARFLRHVRPFWEVRRHRMPPQIGASVDALVADRVLRARAGRVVEAQADATGVTLSLRPRGGDAPQALHVDWVVNCTGPGAGARGSPAVLRPLIEAGHLEIDALGLGVRTRDDGLALSTTRPRDDLFVIGTLRKADLWESTAVPELRVQAATTAKAIATKLGWLS